MCVNGGEARGQVCEQWEKGERSMLKAAASAQEGAAALVRGLLACGAAVVRGSGQPQRHASCCERLPWGAAPLPSSSSSGSGRYIRVSRLVWPCSPPPPAAAASRARHPCWPVTRVAARVVQSRATGPCRAAQGRGRAPARAPLGRGSGAAARCRQAPATEAARSWSCWPLGSRRRLPPAAAHRSWTRSCSGPTATSSARCCFPPGCRWCSARALVRARQTRRAWTAAATGGRQARSTMTARFGQVGPAGSDQAIHGYRWVTAAALELSPEGKAAHAHGQSGRQQSWLARRQRQHTHRLHAVTMVQPSGPHRRHLLRLLRGCGPCQRRRQL